MVDITLLELHLEDASFTANAPFTGQNEEADEDTGGLGGERETTGGFDGKLVTAVGMALVGALAWIAIRRRTGEGIEIDEEIEVLG